MLSRQHRARFLESSSKEGWIPLPLFEPDAGSSAWGGHGAADSPSIPQVPVKTSRRDILRSTHPEPPEPPQGPSAGTDKVQNSVESSPSERPPGLPILRAQPQRQPGSSSRQEHEPRPRDPVPVDAPGTNRPLAPAGLGVGFVPMVHRSLNRARPGSRENSDRSIGRTAFSLGATIASSMLFPLTGAGIMGRSARPGRQPTAANGATDLSPVRRAIDPIVNSPIQPMLSPIPSRTVYDKEDGHGDEVRLRVAGHSEWSAAAPVIGPARSVFAFPLPAAPRAPILSRFVEPLRNTGFASPDAGRVLTTAVESNQVPSDQPFPARLGSTAVPYAEAARAQEGQPPVLNSTGLGSVTRRTTGARHATTDWLPPPPQFRPNPRFPSRSTEQPKLPRCLGARLERARSLRINRQSSIVNRQSNR